MDSKKPMRLLVSYSPDWLLCIGLGAVFWALQSIQGYKRDFSLTDTGLQYRYIVDQRVPPWLLALLALPVPLLFMGLLNAVTVRSRWDFHLSALGLLLSLAITGSITNILKVMVGSPRPDVIDRCRPYVGAHNEAIYGLASASICTQTDHRIMRDGWRSFPSGHSSLSFAGLGFLGFYVAGKLHLFDRRGHTGKAWLALTPFLGASLVAVTRTMDYRHHWLDVVAGSFLGIVVSYFSYRQYFPALDDNRSERAYRPRMQNIELRDDKLAMIPSRSPQSSYHFHDSNSTPLPTYQHSYQTDQDAEPTSPNKRASVASSLHTSSRRWDTASITSYRKPIPLADLEYLAEQLPGDISTDTSPQTPHIPPPVATHYVLQPAQPSNGIPRRESRNSVRSNLGSISEGSNERSWHEMRGLQTSQQQRSSRSFDWFSTTPVSGT